MFFGDFKVAQEVMYGCLDGNKDDLMMMYSAIMHKFTAQSLVAQAALAEHSWLDEQVAVS